MHRGTEKYLAGHAEPEAARRINPGRRDFEGVVVIPAFDESPALVDLIAALPDSLLTILVVNAPPGMHARNTSLLAALDVAPGRDTVSVRNVPNAVIVVDRSTEPLPPKQGVGLARKIGADIALDLMARGMLPETWIHSTDADVTLPPDYGLSVPTLRPELSALVYPFEHVAPPELHSAAALYEISLLHYVLGLALAGSGYAHHTIGSTLAFNPNTYALVRGFPRRAAGEDFYLLNKLAKLGEVQQLPAPLIEVSGRISDRVPIGTGPNVAKIDAMDDAAHNYHYYAPATFQALALVLARMRVLAGDTSVSAPAPFGATDPRVAELVGAWWEREGPAAMLARSSAHKPKQQLRLLTEWFDGFRTMRFIHSMRDAGLASVPLTELAAAWGLAPGSDPQPVLRHLRHLTFHAWPAGHLSGRGGDSTT